MIVELLRELCGWDEVRVVIRNESAIAELCGKPQFRDGDEYVTVEMAGTASHAHIRRASLKRAEIASAEQGNCSVRFLDQNSAPVATVYLPRTNKAKDDFDSARRRAFDALAEKYAQAEGVALLSAR